MLTLSTSFLHDNHRHEIWSPLVLQRWPGLEPLLDITKSNRNGMTATSLCQKRFISPMLKTIATSSDDVEYQRLSKRFEKAYIHIQVSPSDLGGKIWHLYRSTCLSFSPLFLSMLMIQVFLRDGRCIISHLFSLKKGNNVWDLLRFFNAEGSFDLDFKASHKELDGGRFEAILIDLTTRQVLPMLTTELDMMENGTHSSQSNLWGTSWSILLPSFGENAHIYLTGELQGNICHHYAPPRK